MKYAITIMHLLIPNFFTDEVRVEPNKALTI